MMWFLVAAATGQYIGPLPQAACQMAAANLAHEGIVCRQPEAMKACPVPDMVNVYTTCPVFDFPQVRQRVN